MVKNPPASAGDAGVSGSMSGLGRFPGKGNENPLQYSCWEIPWTEEPGGLQFVESQSQTRLSTHAHIYMETDRYITIY